MSRSSFKVFGVAVVLLATVLAGAAYAWDKSEDDRIAEGVSVAGIDVSGMTREEATSAVRHEVVRPLREPLTSTFRGRKFSLSPHRAKVEVHVGRMIGEAFEASQEGGLVRRTWRRLTGGEIDETISLDTEYSREGVEGFVAEVAGAVGREPRNATIEPSLGSLDTLHSRAGLEADSEALVDALMGAIETSDRSPIEVEVKRVRPDVRTRDLASEYPHYLTVDRSGNVLRYFENLKLVKSYTISVGAAGFETPTGLYSIANKAVDPVWNVPNSDWAGDLAGQVIPGGVPENPLKERWLGVADGVGIHGTADVGNLGGPASHGCIRMLPSEVIELYDLVPIGTPILIA